MVASKSISDIESELAASGLEGESYLERSETLLRESGFEYVGGDSCSCKDAGEHGHHFSCGWQEVGASLLAQKVPWAAQDASHSQEGYRWANSGEPDRLAQTFDLSDAMTGSVERFERWTTEDYFEGPMGRDRYWQHVRKEVVDWYDGQPDDSIQNRMDFAAAVHRACWQIASRAFEPVAVS